MYRSLLFQLLKGVPALQNVFESFGCKPLNSNGEISWTVETLKELFRCAIQKLGQLRRDAPEQHVGQDDRCPPSQHAAPRQPQGGQPQQRNSRGDAAQGPDAHREAGGRVEVEAETLSGR